MGTGAVGGPSALPGWPYLQIREGMRTNFSLNAERRNRLAREAPWCSGVAASCSKSSDQAWRLCSLGMDPPSLRALLT